MKTKVTVARDEDGDYTIWPRDIKIERDIDGSWYSVEHGEPMFDDSINNYRPPAMPMIGLPVKKGCRRKGMFHQYTKNTGKETR